VAQRVFAIACGYPDGNDGDRLADDPTHKLLLGLDPIDGHRLASQPTISRFEHTRTSCARSAGSSCTSHDPIPTPSPGRA
jgi:Transposase DDE domain group 1